MAIKAVDQISIVDVTDAYSVILTNEAHTFLGSTSAAKAGSTTTQVIAMVGANIHAASVTLSEITKPSGVTVTKDNDTTTPTLTISVSTSVTTGGVVKIPVHVGDVTITKEFTFGIAFTGATGSTGASGVGISSVDVQYAKSTSSTTAPTSGWSTTAPTWEDGKYIWSRTVTTYTNSTTDTSEAACITGAKGATGAQGATGATGDTGATGATGNGVSSIVEQYYLSTSNTTQSDGSWVTSYPGWSDGKYLWTRSVITYTDGTSVQTVAKCVTGAKGATGAQGATGATGATGPAGADAITMNVTSSGGTIFKNSSIETVLTAHVYKAGVELNATQIAALGTVKWYKDGGTTAVATGTTLTIDAGDVTSKATYTAQLEG